MKTLILYICLGATMLTAGAAEWNQYRGPNHDGISTETFPKWPAKGPRLLWKVPLNSGFSSFSLDGKRVYTLVTREVDGAPKEVCLALDANSGKEVWAAGLDVSKFDGGGDSGTADNKGGDGPRSTPSVSDGKVYTLDSKLNLSCFDASSGKPIWSHDVMKEFHGRNISWQSAASPVIDGKLVFMAGGGEGEALLAFDKETGKLAWKGENDKMTHATPTVAEIHGVRQVIFFTQTGLVSCATDSGKVLWRQQYRYNVSTAASPVVEGDVVYCSAGYGVGSGAYKIAKEGDQFNSTEIWRVTGDSQANHWSTPLAYKGHLYGMFSFKKFGQGPVKCVDLATGKVDWSEPGFGPGNVTLAGQTLIFLNDKGEIVLAEATPEKYTELARVQAIEGKCWSTPVYADGRIYVRSTKEGACYDTSPQVARQ